ncbi:MAG: hypothetical protein JWN90_528 [Parcubacteria group bacterium]|nr:hypothetical protein [Parcubacteria group bacterium]
MWYGADPDLEVLAFRHPLSNDNLDHFHRGRRTRLAPLGVRQIEPIINKVIELGVTCAVCSTADRAYEPLVETAKKHGLPVVTDEVFNEFRRPQSSIGKHSDDPEVAAMLLRRIEEFGPDYVAQDGEEGGLENLMIVQSGLDQLLKIGVKHSAKRMVYFGHGLRRRQIDSWIRSKGNVYLYAQLFKNSYDVVGDENGGLMRFWHGHPYKNKSKRCWNIELSDVTYLPPELRT